MTELVANFTPGLHTYYREMLRNLPEGLSIECLDGGWGHPAPGGKAFWKARGLVHRLGGPNVDAHPAAAIGGRPFFSAQCVLLNKGPWALDLDVASALVSYRHGDLYGPLNRRFLRRRLLAPRCRAITYWSEIARRGTEAYLGEASREKGLLLYPALHPAPPRPANASAEDVHVVYVARKFEHKGGAEAVRAAEALLARHPKLRVTVVSRLPEGYPAPEHPRLGFTSDLSAGELDALWRSADVFLYPTHYEIFGLVVLEAMAHGVPVVALDEYAIPEMVRDGREGRIVPGYAAKWWDAAGLPRHSFDALAAMHRPAETERIVADLVSAVDDLVRDPGLRRRMGEAGRKRVAEGPFSVAAQQGALRELARRLA